MSGADRANGNAEVAEKAPLTLDTVRARLRPFLLANSPSSIEERETPQGKKIAIQKPWGDESPILFVPDEIEPFSDVLNNLYLPERFSAIWHKDTSDLEVIWTAHPLSPQLAEFTTRRFLFQYQSKEYKCEFSRASDRLLLLAKNSQPIASSITYFRNLLSFHIYTTLGEDSGNGESLPEPPIGEPLCFWIRGVEWNEDFVLNLANHLNFYMSYYDTLSPTILIHTPKTEAQDIKPKTRYIAGRFPERITSNELDDNLLHFWGASLSGDTARRFLYCFRIIEYASTLHLDNNARLAIRRALAAPNVLDDLVGATDNVLAAIQKSKLDDYQKFDAVLRETVDPPLLWREISQNINAFATETRFDGGFSVGPLIAHGGREVDFAAQNFIPLAKALREIRNALAHGKDQKTSAVILPTTRNFDRLRPWASLISVAAGEVLLYRKIL